MGGKEEIIHKYKPLTKKEIEERFKQHKAIREKLTKNAAELEQNLMKFNQILDPLVDPETGNCLCWVRRPTQQEWEDMLPTELLQFRGKPENVPDDVWEKYKDFQFEMMARLIEKPKHDAKWWKAHANLVFQQLFHLHIKCVLEELGISTENF